MAPASFYRAQEYRRIPRRDADADADRNFAHQHVAAAQAPAQLLQCVLLGERRKGFEHRDRAPRLHRQRLLAGAAVGKDRGLGYRLGAPFERGGKIAQRPRALRLAGRRHSGRGLRRRRLDFTVAREANVVKRLAVDRRDDDGRIARRRRPATGDPIRTEVHELARRVCEKAA
jgi:hypothetical protein